MAGNEMNRLALDCVITGLVMGFFIGLFFGLFFGSLLN